MATLSEHRSPTMCGIEQFTGAYRGYVRVDGGRSRPSTTGMSDSVRCHCSSAEHTVLRDAERATRASIAAFSRRAMFTFVNRSTSVNTKPLRRTNRGRAPVGPV